MTVAIGIDLGTTNCCIAYVKDDKPIIIPNQSGEYTTPSCISFIGKEILFGKTAMTRRIRNSTNTIYDVKRFIGRSFNDPCVQKKLDRWHFNLVNQKGHILVNVRNEEIDKMYSPEMLDGLLLKHLKKQAELFIGDKVTNAYITVPTYFNDSQRQSTIDAGKIAGFENVRLLNEPTAAAIAYSTEKYSADERTIFVFDFGGGTFDVSLIKYINRDIKVIAIDGDIHTGGNDVTHNLLKFYAKKIKEEYNFDIFKDERKYDRFEQMCEDAKKQLSDTVDANLQIFDLIPEDVELVVERDEFDRINNEIFTRTIEIVDRCLKRSGLDISSIDDIVVVGGSIRIKKVRSLLESYFKKPLKFTINADEAVAMGAAVAASKWSGNESFNDVVFQDICPYSLGVEISGSEMSVIIPKFSSLPARGTKIYCNSRDGQTIIRIKIFSGESTCTKNNNFLGELSISGFKPGPAKSIKLYETFIYDENGILSVEVEERSTDCKKNLEICLDKGRLTQAVLDEQTEVIDSEYQEYESIIKFKEMRQKIVDMCKNGDRPASLDKLCASTLQFVKILTYSKEGYQQLKQKYDLLLKYCEPKE